MIDTFSLVLTHGLLLFAAWRLYNRPDLDREEGEAPKRGWARNQTRNQNGK